MKPLLNENVTAERLGVSVHTMRKWRRLRRGPAFVKFRGGDRNGHGNSGRVAYREEDLDAFIAEMRIPTENPMPEARPGGKAPP